MFTGIITHQATLQSVKVLPKGVRWSVTVSPALESESVMGESMALDGTCLTVVGLGPTLEFDVSPETLDRTTLGRKEIGEQLNLERALRASDRFGGHFVTGHVDCVATIERLDRHEDFWTLHMRLPSEARGLVANKGSLTLNGVSLTINHIEYLSDNGVRAEFMLIPHTVAVTTFKNARTGGAVNIEFDVIARYIAEAVKSYEIH